MKKEGKVRTCFGKGLDATSTRSVIVHILGDIVVQMVNLRMGLGLFLNARQTKSTG